MTTYKIEDNNTYGSKEIYFDGKPSQETRDALKALKFRWNGKKLCWYGFAGEYDIIHAIADSTPEEEKADTFTFTDGYLGGGAYYGANASKKLYGSERKKAICEDIKKLGVKVTGRTHKSTYTDSYTFTITITDNDCLDFYYEYLPLFDDCRVQRDIWRYHYIWCQIDGQGKTITEDLWNGASDEEKEKIRTTYALNCYKCETSSVNIYHIDDIEALKPDFMKKLRKINEIIRSYNYDESNSMVDYFDVGFYYDIDFKYVAA